jgi:hypothetical protein
MNARIWTGFHFRSAMTHGNALGHAVADFAIANYFQPTNQLIVGDGTTTDRGESIRNSGPLTLRNRASRPEPLRCNRRSARRRPHISGAREHGRSAAEEGTRASSA